jgi:hypothetical protein
LIGFVLWCLTPLSIICLCNQCLSPLMLWARISIRARCTALCDKVCQWLATSRWFSPSTPVSPTNNTDHHDITDICFKPIFRKIIVQSWLLFRYYVLPLSYNCCSIINDWIGWPCVLSNFWWWSDMSIHWLLLHFSSTMKTTETAHE